MRRAAALFLLAAAVPAAAQVRDTRPAVEAGATAILRGTVVAADTGRPVARAHVVASPVSGPSHRTEILTDLSGNFEVALPPGTYTVTAGKPGAFLSTQYGQTDQDRPGDTIAVEAESTTTIQIAVFRPGVIAGRVVDEVGEPVPHATILAVRQHARTSNPGAPVVEGFIMTGSGRVTLGSREMRATTNDRGEFRVFGLEPGEYLVMGMLPVPRSSASPTPRRPAVIYYPGVVDPSDAARLRIGVGQEIAPIEFVLRFVPMVVVSGIAMGPDGAPLAGGSISLHVQGVEGLAGLSQVGTIRPDGAFAFEALPGQYLLRARHQIRGAIENSRYRGNLSTSMPLVIGDRDISGLFIQLTYGASLKGRMVFEGAPMPPDKAHRFQVRVESGTPGQVLSAEPGPEGTFELRGIESGMRRLTTAAPPGWILKSVLIGGRDIADREIEFRDGAAIDNVSVVFTAMMSPLTVAVEHSGKSRSAAVVVFPQDQELWHAQSTRILFRTAGEAPVILESLPPGIYYVAAIADVAPSSLSANDRALLERLRRIAEPVQLVEGSPTSVRIRAIPFPE